MQFAEPYFRLQRMESRCAFCDKLSVLKYAKQTFRRNGRTVEVVVGHWECPSNCIGPDGDQPFRYVDMDLGDVNDAAVRAAWKLNFGEELPPSPWRKRPA